jgi:glucose-6-phosphate 1-dehydrogenase
VYRIDHYLTKEVVNNIAMIRFANLVFEPLWSQQYIDEVHITLSESIGIEERGHYYDAFGALRDVVQNHMLELLALICMETPEKLSGDFIRTERAKVLKKVRFSDGILGQCESYKTEKDIQTNSHTETYAFLKLFVDNQRWRGVPFYVKTGKYLNKKETVIHVKFKTVDCLLLKGCPLDSNWLTIQIDPEAVISLTLNIKTPGDKDQMVPVDMEFCHSCIFGIKTPKAYEVLLAEIMQGEQAIAVSFDEITSAWKIVDEIIGRKLPLYTYTKGSKGPEQAHEFAQKHGMRLKV